MADMTNTLETNKIIDRYVNNLSLEIGISRKQIADRLLSLAFRIVRDNPRLWISRESKQALLSWGGDESNRSLIEIGEQSYSASEYDSLITDPRRALVAIRKAIFDVLYPQSISPWDSLMLRLLSGANGDVCAVNCDCGMINELQQGFGEVHYPEGDLTEFERVLLALPRLDIGDVIGKAASESAVFFMQFECKMYASHHRRLPAYRYLDLDDVTSRIRQLEASQAMILLVPTALLAYPGGEGFRSRIIESGHLRAVMDLRRRPNREPMSVIVLTGKTQSSFIALQSTWDMTINFVKQPKRELRTILSDFEAGEAAIDGWHKVELSEAAKNGFLFPDFFAENEARHGEESPLRSFASLINPEVDRPENAKHLRLSDLTPEKPISPVDLSELPKIECKENDRVSVYRIMTDRVVYLALRDGTIFTGYSEGVKGEVLATTDQSLFVICIQSDNLTPQYLAQEFHTEIIATQLRACDYFSRHTSAPLSCSMSESLMQIRISNSSIIEQTESFRHEVESRVRLEENDWKKELEDYKLTMRKRKHAVSNVLMGLSADWNQLLKYCAKNNGIIDSQDVIGVKSPVRVSELLESIGACISEIKPMVENFAAIDSNYGDVKTINILDFIKIYIRDIQNKEITVENNFLDLDGSKFDIEFPERALKIVLDNIVSNAKLHGFKNVTYEKKMAFYLGLEGNFVSLAIKNNGLSLTETEDRKLFNPASYLPKIMIDGHLCEGIGNPQSREIMEQFGGRISLHPVDDTFSSDHPEESYKVEYKLQFNSARD